MTAKAVGEGDISHGYVLKALGRHDAFNAISRRSDASGASFDERRARCRVRPSPSLIDESALIEPAITPQLTSTAGTAFRGRRWPRLSRRAPFLAKASPPARGQVLAPRRDAYGRLHIGRGRPSAEDAHFISTVNEPRRVADADIGRFPRISALGDASISRRSAAQALLSAAGDSRCHDGCPAARRHGKAASRCLTARRRTML